MQDLLAGNLCHESVEEERCLRSYNVGSLECRAPRGREAGEQEVVLIHVVPLHLRLRLRGLPPDPVALWHVCSITLSPLPSQKLCSAPGFFETLFEGTLRTALSLSDSMLPYSLGCWITEITERSGSLLKNADPWV